MDEEQGGGGFLIGKIMGIPTIVWIAIVGIGAYFLLSRGSSSGASSSGGGGTATQSGTTDIQKGAIQISVSQENPNKAQPKPPVHKKIITHHKHPVRQHPHHPPVKHPVKHPPHRTHIPLTVQGGGGNAGGNERPPVRHRDKQPHNFRTKWGKPPRKWPPVGGPGGPHPRA